jgi:hypothetical protein
VKENIIYIKSSNSNESQGEYALSKEVVWQVEIPETYGAYLIMNPINLQPPVKGICVDYVAVDFHGDDREPDVACGNVNIRHYVTTKSSRLTIKFVSDESINAGFFHGGLLIYPAHCELSPIFIIDYKEMEVYRIYMHGLLSYTVTGTLTDTTVKQEIFANL